jgi:Na+/phosphate symporter
MLDSAKGDFQMIILLPLLVALIGVMLYAVSNTKLAEIGRIMFFCGLLAFLLSYHGQAITVVR